MIEDDKLALVVKEISEYHRQIIEGWSKAYLAQLYEEGEELKPGAFILCEQVPTIHDGKWVRKYWFEKKKDT